MVDNHTELTQAYQLMRQKRFAEADAICRRIVERAPRDAAAIHLLGLICKDSGQAEEGERLLRASIDLLPTRAEFHANLANLLRRTGRLKEAVESYRKALACDVAHLPARLGLSLALNDLGEFAAAESEARTLLASRPGDTQALVALAMALSAQGKSAEAESTYRQAIAVDASNVIAHHNLASLLVAVERGEEALAHLDRAESLGLSGRELLFNRARALSQCYRFDEAEATYARVVALDPRNLDAQFNLAQLRYMRGDPMFARDLSAAAAAARDDIALQTLFANIMHRVGDTHGAEILLRDVIARRGPIPSVRGALARILHESGRLKEAEGEALEAASADPHNLALIETLIGILLAEGKPDEAQPFIRTRRTLEPTEQRWIAYEATAARLLGDPLYHELYDYDRLVRSYDIQPPKGWSSVEELNAALVKSLLARHRLSTHPFDQSVRNGTQTARSLLSDPDPVVRAALAAFTEPLQAYCREVIGKDAHHPLSSRNVGQAAFAGAWSILLRREGFHVNHIHPRGWISSAYYVSVPAETRDEVLMSGWLKFGETPQPVPGASAERFVQPLAGRLVLFPSYMWHGTNPIHGGESRLTIAFDAVPVTPPK